MPSDILDLQAAHPDPDEAMARQMFYFLLPLWMLALTADWYFHLRSDIEHTAGLPESIMHNLGIVQVGVPLVIGLTCEVNAGVFSVMAGSLLVHQATAYVDSAFASKRREITLWEHHTHSLFEVLPLAALAVTASSHWETLRGKPQWGYRWKRKRLPLGAFAALGVMTLTGALLYGNEAYRCWRAGPSKS